MRIKGAKPKKTGSALYFLLLIITFFSMLFCIRSDLDPSRGSNSELHPIRISGAYSMNGCSYQPLKSVAILDVSDYNTLTVKGHFSQKIPKNKQLMLRLSNVMATLKVNGKTVYTNAQTQEHGFCRSPGNGWSAVSSLGITESDNILLILSNVYKNGNPKTFSHALDKMYVGYENDLARLIFKQSAGSILFGFLTVPLGLLLFLIGIVIKQSNREHIFSLALFCLSVGAWILADPYFMSFLSDSPCFLLSIGQIAQFLQLVSLTKFVHSIVHQKVRAFVGIIHWLTFVLFTAAGFCQLFGIRDYYDFTRIFMIMCCIVCVTMLGALITETFHGDDFAKKTLLSILPLGIFSLTEQLAWKLGYYYQGYFTQAGFLIFLTIQAVYTIGESKRLLYRLEASQRMENELIQGRISVMLSQIQPHFLCNSLMGIKQLCDTEPQMASEALEHFSYYLRGNLDSLTNASLIPFEKELEHVQNYLFLEKMRFGKKLTVKTELTETGFTLPPLTLQPLVENAVRYGIMKKKEGGVIIIRSESSADSITITILDNGVGFDTDILENENRLAEDGRTHVGIKNVRNRLKMQCRGSLHVSSQIGAGTRISITLPKIT